MLLHINISTVQVNFKCSIIAIASTRKLGYLHTRMDRFGPLMFGSDRIFQLPSHETISGQPGLNLPRLAFCIVIQLKLQLEINFCHMFIKKSTSLSICPSLEHIQGYRRSRVNSKPVCASQIGLDQNGFAFVRTKSKAACNQPGDALFNIYDALSVSKLRIMYIISP